MPQGEESFLRSILRSKLSLVRTFAPSQLLSWSYCLNCIWHISPWTGLGHFFFLSLGLMEELQITPCLWWPMSSLTTSCLKHASLMIILVSFAILPWLSPALRKFSLCSLLAHLYLRMFKRYHMEHHQFQGDQEKDVDIPTRWEGEFFKGTFLKCIWLLLQPLFYALRPTIVRPKAPRPLDIFNTVAILTTDAIIAYYLSPVCVLYLVLSTLLGMGFHPVAGHFISEHYVFTPGYETYSYYGSLNYICWNVGYHNEHHDFPRVPGWKLPMVTKMAPEFYENLPHYSSWTRVLYNYLTDPTMGPFSRVRRHMKEKVKSS